MNNNNKSPRTGTTTSSLFSFSSNNNKNTSASSSPTMTQNSTPNNNNKSSLNATISISEIASINEIISKANSNNNNNNVDSNLVISKIRRLSEIITIADTCENEAILEYFYEKNFMEKLCDFVISYNSTVELKVQVLQTLSILFQSLKGEITIYHMFSQNNVNRILLYFISFIPEMEETSEEEILAVFVGFIKTLALKLDLNYIHFFYNEQETSFPLFEVCILLLTNKDMLIRSNVRNILLLIYKIQSKPLHEQYLKTLKRQDFKTIIINDCLIKTSYDKLTSFVLLEKKDDAGSMQGKTALEMILRNFYDDLLFFQDLIDTIKYVEEEGNYIANDLLECFFNPFVQVITVAMDGNEEMFDNHMVLLCVVFLAVSNEAIIAFLLGCVKRLIFQPQERFAKLFFKSKNKLCIAMCLIYSIFTNKVVLESVRRGDAGEILSKEFFLGEMFTYILREITAKDFLLFRLICKVVVHLVVFVQAFKIESREEALLKNIYSKHREDIMARRGGDELRTLYEMESEWLEIKKGPLKVDALLFHSAHKLLVSEPSSNNEKDRSVYCFIIARLFVFSLQGKEETAFASLVNESKLVIQENVSMLDLKKFEYLPVKINNVEKLALIIIYGSLILVSEETKVCKCIIPVHRVELGTDLLDKRALHWCVIPDQEKKILPFAKKNVVPPSFLPCQTNGMYVKGTVDLLFMHLVFETEAKAGFARENIEKAYKRILEEKKSKLLGLLMNEE